jgi:hypothetical protein
MSTLAFPSRPSPPDHLTGDYGLRARNQRGWSPSGGTLCTVQQ